MFQDPYSDLDDNNVMDHAPIDENDIKDEKYDVINTPPAYEDEAEIPENTYIFVRMKSFLF